MGEGGRRRAMVVVVDEAGSSEGERTAESRARGSGGGRGSRDVRAYPPAQRPNCPSG